MADICEVSSIFDLSRDLDTICCARHPSGCILCDYYFVWETKQAEVIKPRQTITALIWYVFDASEVELLRGRMFLYCLVSCDDPCVDHD